jgi:hypothetical protein
MRVVRALVKEDRSYHKGESERKRKSGMEVRSQS